MLPEVPFLRLSQYSIEWTAAQAATPDVRIFRDGGAGFFKVGSRGPALPLSRFYSRFSTARHQARCCLSGGVKIEGLTAHGRCQGTIAAPYMQFTAADLEVLLFRGAAIPPHPIKLTVFIIKSNFPALYSIGRPRGSRATTPPAATIR